MENKKTVRKNEVSPSGAASQWKLCEIFNQSHTVRYKNQKQCILIKFEWIE
jgi:hypothetical protein